LRSSACYAANSQTTPCLPHLRSRSAWVGHGVAKHPTDVGLASDPLRIAPFAKLAGHGHGLTRGRYVGAEVEHDEPFEEKMTRLVGRLREQRAKRRRLEKEIEKNLPRAFSQVDGVFALDPNTGNQRLHVTEPPTLQDVQHVVATVALRANCMLRRKGLLGEPSHDSNEAHTVDDALDARPNVGRGRGRFEHFLRAVGLAAAVLPR
jgi:hypothetical protein